MNHLSRIWRDPTRWVDADMTYEAERRRALAFLLGLATVVTLGLIALLVLL